MPTYAARADVVLAAGGEERLLQIADFDGDGIEDVGLVDDALDESEGTINAYARKRFDVPFSPVPEIIKRLAANLAVYTLKARRDSLTEADAMRQEQRIGWLEGLASGKIDPGLTPAPTPSAHNKPAATDRPTAKAISRENLKGFA